MVTAAVFVVALCASTTGVDAGKIDCQRSAPSTLKSGVATTPSISCAVVVHSGLSNMRVQLAVVAMALRYAGQFWNTVPAIVSLAELERIRGVITTESLKMGLPFGPVPATPLGRHVHMICVFVIIAISPRFVFGLKRWGV